MNVSKVEQQHEDSVVKNLPRAEEICFRRLRGGPLLMSDPESSSSESSST